MGRMKEPSQLNESPEKSRAGWRKGCNAGVLAPYLLPIEKYWTAQVYSLRICVRIIMT